MQTISRDPLWPLVILVAVLLLLTVLQPEKNREDGLEYLVIVQNDTLSGRTHVYFRQIE